MMIAVRSCWRCGTRTSVTVDEEGYRRWLDGALLQEALPSLSVDERELLLTGICPPCWSVMFNSGDDVALPACIVCKGTEQLVSVHTELGEEPICVPCRFNEPGPSRAGTYKLDPKVIDRADELVVFAEGLVADANALRRTATTAVQWTLVERLTKAKQALWDAQAWMLRVDAERRSVTELEVVDAPPAGE